MRENGVLLGFTYTGTPDPDYVAPEGWTPEQIANDPNRLLIKTREVIRVIPSAGQLALSNAERNLQLYGVFVNGVPNLDNDFTRSYVEAIERIRGQMLASGEAVIVNGAFITIDRESRVIVIDDIVAAAGRIRILTDQLHGTGTFDAPQNVTVSIISDTSASVEFGEIFIPERNGGVDFNGVTVTEQTSIGDVRIAIRDLNRISVGKDNRPLEVVPDLEFLGFVQEKSPNNLNFTAQSFGQGVGAAPEIEVQISKNIRTINFGGVSLPTNDQVITFAGRIFAPTADISVFGPVGPNEVSVVFLADVTVKSPTVTVPLPPNRSLCSCVV